MVYDPTVLSFNHPGVKLSEIIKALSENPNLLSSKDFLILARGHEKDLGDFISRSKDPNLVAALCEASLIRLGQIHKKEIESWQEKEVLSTFDSGSVRWMKTCRTRHLKASRRARKVIELKKKFSEYKEI